MIRKFLTSFFPTNASSIFYRDELHIVITHYHLLYTCLRNPQH